MFRQIHTSLQSEPWFLDLSYRGRLVFYTLITSDLLSLTGFYSASTRRLAYDTGLTPDDTQSGLAELVEAQKVVLLPDLDMVFLTRFSRWQGTKSPKFQAGLTHSLNNLPPEARALYTLWHTLSDRVSYTPTNRVSKSFDAVRFQNVGDINHKPEEETINQKPEPPLSPPTQATTTTTTVADDRLKRAATTYENEIGMITPSLSDKLTEAIEIYPIEWILESITLSAAANARRWSYAEAILKRWKAEGKDNGVKPQKGAHGADKGTTTENAELRKLRAAIAYEDAKR